MKYGVYSIRDQRAGFLTPTVDMNDEIAIRNFAHAVKASDKSLFFTDPQDFSLYHIGYFDTETGDIDHCVPVVLAMATDYVMREKDGDLVEVSNTVQK